MNTDPALTRRQFLQTGATASAALLTHSTGLFAAGSDRLRIALIGCGDRGTAAAKDCLESSPGLELVAMADMFRDQLDVSLADIRKAFPNAVKVTPETSFLGFDAYKKVMAMAEVDVVLLTTPPGFRPLMVRSAVEAGKHIFMEKPGAVDPVGVRSLMASAALADQKRLSIVVGTQQRYQPQYREIIKRIQNGQIGKITGGQAYWNWGSAHWHFQPRKPEWSDMEWQLRCWPYFTWLSGDHIVEQHLHNMDVINWAIGTHPSSCLGMGGRQVRTGPEYGNIFDHFTVEYEYPGGIRVMSMCSQIQGSTARVGERLVGAQGWSYTTRQYGYIEGDSPYKYQGEVWSGLVAEHAALIQSIRGARPINECGRLAESTMTLILGRMSAYSGRALSWDWAMNESQLNLTPAKLEMGPLPVAPLPVPGREELS